MMALLGRLGRDARGVAAVEFAMLLPVLLLFSLGTLEFGRLIMLTQKLQNGSFILADLVTRDKTIDEAEMANIFLALGTLIEPFPFEAQGTAIVTSVGTNAAGAPVVKWQRQGSGTLDAASAIGQPGGAAVLPATLTLAPGDTVIATEVFYDFEPMFDFTTSAQVVRKAAFYKPRLGTLDRVDP